MKRERKFKFKTSALENKVFAKHMLFYRFRDY